MSFYFAFGGFGWGKGNLWVQPKDGDHWLLELGITHSGITSYAKIWQRILYNCWSGPIWNLVQEVNRKAHILVRSPMYIASTTPTLQWGIRATFFNCLVSWILVPLDITVLGCLRLYCMPEWGKELLISPKTLKITYLVGKMHIHFFPKYDVLVQKFHLKAPDGTVQMLYSHPIPEGDHHAGWVYTIYTICHE